MRNASLPRMDEPSPNAPIPATQIEQIRNALFAGNKIEAIKLFRAGAPEASLAEAKTAVEALEAQLRASSPERFAAKRSGCAVHATMTVGSLIAVIAWLLLR